MNPDGVADRVADGLVAEGLVRSEDRARARTVIAAGLAEPEPAAAAGLPKLVEVVAYLGAALVLAAAGLFLARTWNDLSENGQVAALAVSAAVLAIAGVIARPGADSGAREARRRLAGVLLTGGAVVAGFALGLGIENTRNHGEFVSYRTDWPSIAAGLLVVVLAAVGYRLASSAVGLLGILGGAVTAASGLASSQDGDEALWVGSSFAAVGLVWLLLTEIGAFRERTTARALGVAVLLFGSQAVALGSDHHPVGYALTAGVAVGGVLLYLSRLDWPYLAAAVIAVTLVVPEAVSDWTEGSLGVIGGVLVAGITLLAASFAGYRLRVEAKD